MDQRSIVTIDLVGGMTCDDCVVHVAEALESAVRATGQYNAFERRRERVAGA